MHNSVYSSDDNVTWSNPDYELISELGRGGMGVVYKARRISDQRLLAVKVLPKFTSPELLLRFQRETQVLARLEHPHIVKTVDYGEESSPFFSMEFMEGRDLERLFEDRLESTGQPFDVKEALELLAPIAEALAYCHSQNILHRDIKLANIFINRGGYPVLVDFGVSKQKNEHTQSSYEKTLSKSQEFVGTVAYMSPEQLSNSDEFGFMGPGTDVWSLGTALFQLLTGNFPFPAPSPVHLFVSITENPAPSIRAIRPDIPKWLDHLLLQMLSKQSAKRPSMEQVAQSLRNQTSERSQSARGYSSLWPIALCVTATAMIILAFLPWQSHPPLQFSELTPPPAFVTSKNYTLSGQLNQGPVTISIGDRKDISKVDGRFELSLPLKEGVNLIKLTFSIGRGQELKRSYQIHRDTKAPVIQWSLPGIDDSQSYLAIDDRPSIKGKVIDTSLDSLTVNETSIPIEAHQFVIPSALWDSTPDRVLVLRAQDKAGNKTERLIKVRPPILNDHERWRWASREAQDRVIENLIMRVRAPFQYLETKSYECGGRKYRIPRFRHKKTGLVLHLVPGGDFNMGIPNFPNELMYVKRVTPKMDKFARKQFKNATPQRRVQMKPFLIASVELTEQQWAVGSVGKSKVTPEQPKGKLNRSLISEWLQDFPKLRLPSEAEWEYAARAGTNTRYFWGDELDGRYFWYVHNSRQRIHLVTEHRNLTNAFGLSDVIGNLWELVADDFRPDYRIPPTQEPYFQSPKRKKLEHIFRGGGAVNPLISQSLTLRMAFPPGLLDYSYGVRLAASFDKVFHPNR